jgi:uncharacterized protein (TIGR03435 family)
MSRGASFSLQRRLQPAFGYLGKTGGNRDRRTFLGFPEEKRRRKNWKGSRRICEKSPSVLIFPVSPGFSPSMLECFDASMPFLRSPLDPSDARSVRVTIRKRSIVRTIALFVSSSLTVLAQTAPQLEFDVASVRLMPPATQRGDTVLQLAPGGFNANYAALRQLAGVAYNIQRVRVEGGPSWMDSDLYTIAAKTEKPDTSDNADQVREMLRALLADRFKFVAHREIKQLTVYALVLGRNGSKLEEVKDPPPHPSTMRGTGKFGPQLVCRSYPIAGLVNLLANTLGSPVMDQTGLKGRYNFTLEFTPEGRPPQPDSAPDLFEAIQDQLGLRLEGKKGSAEVLIVDHAEKATAN